MIAPVDLTKLTPAAEISGEDSTETAILQEMLADAERYLGSFRWCPTISERYMGFGIGGVIGLFLFRLSRPIGGADDWLWVVVGDLPAAYFVVDRANDVKSALATYCDLMDDWINAIARRQPLDGVFPVAAEQTDENSRMLRSRIDFIRKRIIPSLD
jgi:hypothetical protein